MQLEVLNFVYLLPLLLVLSAICHADYSSKWLLNCWNSDRGRANLPSQSANWRQPIYSPGAQSLPLMSAKVSGLPFVKWAALNAPNSLSFTSKTFVRSFYSFSTILLLFFWGWVGVACVHEMCAPCWSKCSKFLCFLHPFLCWPVSVSIYATAASLAWHLVFRPSAKRWNGVGGWWMVDGERGWRGVSLIFAIKLLLVFL